MYSPSNFPLKLIENVAGLVDAELLHTFRAMPQDMIAMVHCENDAIVTDATADIVDVASHLLAQVGHFIHK